MKQFKYILNPAKQEPVTINQMRKMAHQSSMALIKSKPNWEQFFIDHYDRIYEKEMSKLKNKVKFKEGKLFFEACL